jgi:hypothetical protein
MVFSPPAPSGDRPLGETSWAGLSHPAYQSIMSHDEPAIVEIPRPVQLATQEPFRPSVRRIYVYYCGKCVLAAAICVAPPIGILLVLLAGADHSAGRTEETLSPVINHFDAAVSGTSNLTCARNITAAITVEPAGATADESCMVDGDLDTTWYNKPPASPPPVRCVCQITTHCMAQVQP